MSTYKICFCGTKCCGYLIQVPRQGAFCGKLRDVRSYLIGYAYLFGAIKATSASQINSLSMLSVVILLFCGF